MKKKYIILVLILYIEALIANVLLTTMTTATTIAERKPTMTCLVSLPQSTVTVNELTVYRG